MGDEKKPELRGIAKLLYKERKSEANPEEKVKAQLKELKGEKKLRFILNRLTETPSQKEKSILREALFEAIPDSASQKLHMSYDNPNEGLESTYFWILDFFQNVLGYKVSKTKEDFESSVGSAFYSDFGAKATRMQEQAMKMMGSINTIVRSNINILYDLREFQTRLATYSNYNNAKDPQKKREGLISLKQVWMDQVDVKKGVGSINGLSQQLQFITLRDAFLQVPTAADVEKSKVDLNDRVKRILMVKLSEFELWVPASEHELRKRFEIEKKYLKSQVASLKLYAEWTKPYLVAAKKLGMKGFDNLSIQNPNIVSAFNNLEIELELMGKQEQGLQPLIEEEKLPEEATITQKYYKIIIVRFKYRSSPAGQNTQQGYMYKQGGRFDMYFYSFVVSEKELKALEEAKENEAWDIISDMVDSSIREMADDLIKFLDDDMKYEKAYQEQVRKDEEAEKHYAKGPFSALFGGLKSSFKPLSQSISWRKPAGYYDTFVKKEAQGSADGAAFTLYDIYKKAHGMLSV